MADDTTTRSPGIAEVVAEARRRFDGITALTAESVSRVERVDGGWRATFEVVELERVPRSTDVLASYDVDLDESGDLRSWRRTRRYLRSDRDAP